MTRLPHLFLLRPLSLRAYLLLGLLLPIGVLVVFNSISLYAQALVAVNTAYDRTLLASANPSRNLKSFFKMRSTLRTM